LCYKITKLQNIVLLLLPQTELFQSHRCHQKTFVNLICHVQVGKFGQNQQK